MENGTESDRFHTLFTTVRHHWQFYQAEYGSWWAMAASIGAFVGVIEWFEALLWIPTQSHTNYPFKRST